MCSCTSSQRTLTVFVRVVALRCVVLITECYNYHKHSSSPLTNVLVVMFICACCKVHVYYTFPMYDWSTAGYRPINIILDLRYLQISKDIIDQVQLWQVYVVADKAGKISTYFQSLWLSSSLCRLFFFVSVGSLERRTYLCISVRIKLNDFMASCQAIHKLYSKVADWSGWILWRTL